MNTLHPLQRFAFAAALAILSTACRADAASDAAPPPTRCELHEPHDTVLDPQELALRTAHPSDFVRVCRTAGRATRYSVVTMPRHIDPGLCRFTESFAGPDSRSETWVVRDRGLCPAPGSAGYFWIDGVPDEVLPRLLDLANDLATSDAGFDKVAQNLDPAATPRESRQFEDLRHAMRSGATRLLSIERVGPHEELRDGWFMTFSDASSPSTSWRLGVVAAGERVLLRRVDEGAID